METQMVQNLVIGVAVLLVGIAIFNQIFASPECDSMAEESAYQLATAINQAPMLASSDREPLRGDVDKYIPVPIRFCQHEDSIKLLSFSLLGDQNLPDYQVFYENFPESGILDAWTEEYPWSQGFMNAVVFHYGMISTSKVLAKRIRAVGGIPSKTKIKGVKGTVSIPSRMYNKIKSAVRKVTTSEFASNMRTRFGSLKTWTRNKFGLTNFADDFYKKFPGLKKRADRLDLVAKYKGEKNYNYIFKKLLKQDIEEEIFDDGKIASKFKNVDDLKTLNTYLKTLPYEDEFAVRAEYGIPKTSKWTSFKESIKTKYADGIKTDKIYWWFTEKAVKAGKISKKAVTSPFRLYRNIKTNYRAWIKAKKTGGRVLKGTQTDMAFDSMLSTSVRHKKFAKDFFDVTDDKALKKTTKKLNKFLKERDGVIAIHPESKLNKYAALDDMISDGTLIDVDELGNFRASYDLSDYLDGSFKSADSNFQRAFTSAAVDSGFETTEADKLWSVLRKGYRNTKDIGGGSVGVQGMRKSLYHDYFDGIRRGMKRGTQDAITEKKMWTDAIKGFEVKRSGIRQVSYYVWPRAKRMIFIDTAKYSAPPLGFFNYPYWFGAGTMEETERSITEEFDTANSLILTKGKNIISLIGLNDEITDYGVRIWRPKPDLDKRTPMPWISSIWFRQTIKESPRFYSVSPCFGIAKIWKGTHPEDDSRDTIYISIDGDANIAESGEKCRIDDDQCIKNNYCYADNDRIWGEGWDSGENDLWDVATAAAATYGGVIAICPGGLATPWCRLAASYAAEGAVSGITTAHYLSESEKECTSSWSYWQYIKATDICDFVGTVGSIGSSPEGSFGKGLKAGVKNSVRGGGLLADLCLIPQAQGDITAGWPSIGLEKGGLSLEEIKRNQGSCVFGFTP